MAQIEINPQHGNTYKTADVRPEGGRERVIRRRLKLAWNMHVDQMEERKQGSHIVAVRPNGTTKTYDLALDK